MVDFLGIGVQKGGTTWLYRNLVRHPDVWLPFIKEVHFFDRRFLGAEGSKKGRRARRDFQTHPLVRKIRQRIRKLRDGRIASDFGNDAEISYLTRLIDRNFFMTEEWYDFLFSPAPAGRKTGEITPYYCAIGEAGIAALKLRFPAAKLIYLIRDPVDRALSCLRMVGGRLGFDMTDPEDLAKLANRCLKSQSFYRRGDFRSHIPLWDRHFGDQVLYLPFGRIRSDPQGIFRQIESFIGIRPFDGYPLLGQRVHASVQPSPIPDQIRQRFAELNRAQYSFLEGRFAPDFVDNLR
jgi:sulfotransferase family protein